MTNEANTALTATDMQAAWERYAAIWKLDGAEAKRKACATDLDPRCVYTDPMTRCAGWDELVGYMVEFHSQIPGGHFVTTEFMAHHDRSVVRWNMVAGDGSIIGNGMSYGEYADDGRVKTMTGFFDVPA